MHKPLTAQFVLALLCLAAPFAAAQDEDTEGLTVTVVTPYTEMHTGPGRGYPVFHVAERHQQLQLLKRRTDWYKVTSSDGKTGWVKRKDLNGAELADDAVLDFSTAHWSDYGKRRWELGLQGGEFSGAAGVNLFLGFRMLQSLSAEVKYTQAFGSFSDSKLASFNLVHRPFPSRRLTPFFTLGAGAIKISPHTALVESDDREDNLYTVGLGALYTVSDRFAVRAEYNHHTILTTREDNEEVNEWKTGFSVSF